MCSLSNSPSNFFILDISLKHGAFMLGTSKTKNDGGGFDLFITTAPIPDLNEKINVFGRVIKGEDVVQPEADGRDADSINGGSRSGRRGSRGVEAYRVGHRPGLQAKVLEDDDWGVNSEFVGGNETTTELEGPPPPAGVSTSAAKNKGMDNYKQGQFADAIKWLSWAVVLLEKADDDDGTMEVLSSRASCYKKVGEYKKVVADCTKVSYVGSDLMPSVLRHIKLMKIIEESFPSETHMDFHSGLFVQRETHMDFKVNPAGKLIIKRIIKIKKGIYPEFDGGYFSLNFELSPVMTISYGYCTLNAHPVMTISCGYFI
ncbi:peptidyl-prolyl cis-trans isomerase cyp21-3 mitochondrial [Phtheirospermum japonicum]|uniref:Peptidyl-prolyl cis-trans isomerase cyp21-3 mitochondrial n=1 Tax=Phtheirospermum japonicum TaxID=374723 RepID=A0A830BVG9_9LAMI|nr:peptidyl-prolyl cis-trans isomerase cyp21-3 mitochondrial [Phtheirospermum japonicum]